MSADFKRTAADRVIYTSLIVASFASIGLAVVVVIGVVSSARDRSLFEF
jgi:hypothetical protein